MLSRQIDIQPNHALAWSQKLLGQDKLWARLRMSIESGRYPHCSLILGRPGSGQLIAALATAQQLLCRRDQTSCGHCPACLKMKDLVHPDLLFMFPLPGSTESCDEYSAVWRKALHETPYMTITQWVEQLGSNDKNANININEVRRFIDKVYLKPFEAHAKVAIIWLPEYLGKEGNSLLKLLEEPPDYSYIILVAEQKELILPTILSRAQTYVLESLEPAHIQEYLMSNFGLQPDEAFTIASYCDGNVQAAIQASHESLELGIGMIKQLFQKCYQYDVLGMTQWIDAMVGLPREGQRNTLFLLQQILSYALRFKFDPSSAPPASNAVYQYAHKISAYLSLDAMEKMVQWSDDAYYALHRYGHPKLTMHSFCLKFSRLLHAKPSIN